MSKCNETEKIFNMLLPTMNKMYAKYSFTEISKEKYSELVRKCIEEYEFNPEKTDIPITEFYGDAIKASLNEYIKEQLSDSNVTIIVNYINMVFPDGTNYKKIIDSFSKINAFFEELDYEVDLEVLMSMIKDTKKLEDALRLIYSRNEKIVTTGEFIDKFDNTTASLLQAYCIINGISVEFDNLEVPFFDEEELEDGDFNTKEDTARKVKDIDMDFLAEDSVQAFRMIANSYPLLKDEEVMRYLEEKNNGSEYARDMLINSNLRLVMSIGKRFKNHGLSFEDILQEGTTGLITAVDKYNPNRNCKLSTYSVWWIGQAIRKAIADKGRTIRIPVHKYEKLIKMRQIENKLREKLEREPRIDEIATEMKVPYETVVDLYQYKQDTISYNAKILDSDDEGELGDFLASNDQPLDERMGTLGLKEKLYEILMKTKISERDREIMLMRYGLGATDEEKTLQAIGIKYNMTRERIRQIENHAFYKMICLPETEALADYMDNPVRARIAIRMLKEKTYEKNYNHKKAVIQVQEELTALGPKILELSQELGIESGTNEIKTTSFLERQTKMMRESTLGRDFIIPKGARHGKSFLERVGVSKEMYEKYIVPELHEWEVSLINKRHICGIDAPVIGKLTEEETSTFYKMLNKICREAERLKTPTIYEMLGLSKNVYDEYIVPTLSEDDFELLKRCLSDKVREQQLKKISPKSVRYKQLYGDLLPRMKKTVEELGLQTVTDDCDLGALVEENKDNEYMSDDIETVGISECTKCIEQVIDGATEQYDPVAARLPVKNQKIELAISLYEENKRLVARDKQLDSEIRKQMTSFQDDDKGKEMGKVNG